MLVESVRIQYFRCVAQVNLNLGERHNLISGDNGSGKTSLLEALYLLGRGQSFRLGAHRRLIQDGQPWCLVRATLRDPAGHRIPVAIQKSTEETRLRIAQQGSARISELARYCPVLVLEPGQHRLLEDGPNLRRRYLDWTVFHVEQAYLDVWRRYSRALRQRNALLRNRQKTQLLAWDREFVLASEALHGCRQRIFNELLKDIQALCSQFLGDSKDIRVDYRRGWAGDRKLEDLLREQLAQDLERGFTQSGPQRAELRVMAQGHLARDVLSRGQQKLLLTAMLLGQARHFQRGVGETPLLLVDDLASELAAPARERLFGWLQDYPGQTVMTALDAQVVPEGLRSQSRMFHVEHGALQPG